MSIQADIEKFEEGKEKKLLFKLSQDAFVNEGAVEMARGLGDLVEIESNKILINSEASKSEVAERVEDILREGLSQTHRRTNVAHQINDTVDERDELDDSLRVGAPNTHFPMDSDEDETVYENDTVNIEELRNVGIDPSEIDIDEGDEKSLYTLSPTFVGRPQPGRYGFQASLDNTEDYFDIFTKYIEGEYEGSEDDYCTNCGSSGIPSWQVEDEEGNKIKLEHSQASSILLTKSSNPSPLGQGSPKSSYQGRCVSCLIAGFYYTLIEKAVRLVSFDDGGEYRIFTPVGDFEELRNIRGDLTNIWESGGEGGRTINEPTSNSKARQQNIGSTRSRSKGIQILDFFSEVLRQGNIDIVGGEYSKETIHRPTSLITYITSPMKSGNYVREIKSFESVDSDSWIYEVVRERELEPEGQEDEDWDESYWAVPDVLSWFANISQNSEEVGIDEKDMIGYGIIEKDLKQIERGLFELLKKVEKEKGEITPYMLPIAKTRNYFGDIMRQSASTESIDSEQIESITNVASNLGGMFYDRDNISVLISLQSSNTPSEFLQAFEKASMQAQKMITDEGEGGEDEEFRRKAINRWSGKEDIETVLELITDPDKFEDAKRMFVIQASLSAHYQNSVKNYQESQSDTGGDQ
ncbi:hypothetical protein ACEU6E_09105 [Halorutilales archaeon Cl-col2-1]